MDFSKYKESLKILVGAAFLLFGVWNVVSPVSETQVITLIDLVAAIIGAIIGAPAAIRFATKKQLVDKE